MLINGYDYQITTVIALIVRYYHVKFQSAVIHRSQDMTVFNLN